MKLFLNKVGSVCGSRQQRRRQRGEGCPHKKIPLVGAVASVFPNVSLAMCPLKLSLPIPHTC